MSVPDGIHVINAAPAGSVTVAVKDGVLSLVSVDIAGSWSRTKTEMSAREIELEFENEGTELKVKAEIEDGHVKLRAEFKTDDDSAHDDSADDDSGHGSDDGSSQIGRADIYWDEHERCGDREDPGLRTIVDGIACESLSGRRGPDSGPIRRER